MSEHVPMSIDATNAPPATAEAQEADARANDSLDSTGYQFSEAVAAVFW